MKIYIAIAEERQEYLNEIDNVVRKYNKNNMTIEYQEKDSLLVMVMKILGKIDKEKDIHQNAIQYQAQVSKEYSMNMRKKEEEVDYLKELLIE